MRLFKKASHCLFVEEEQYKWAERKSSLNRKLVYLSLLFIACGLLFGLLSQS